MKIKTKILWTLLGMSFLVALVGALAVNRQHAAAMLGVTQEAEDVARVVSFLFASDSNKLSSASAQQIVAKLHQAQGRDVVVVDSRQTVLADADPSEIGKNFTEDQEDEVGATIKDGRIRTFVEVSRDYPGGIKQIVVPIEGAAGQVMGAVVLEYTPLYNMLMQLTRSTIRQVVLTGIGSVVIALLIAFYMGRSIATPLAQLTKVATGFASGQTDLPMPPPRTDEIGDLANAFTNMVHKRQRAEDELRLLRDQLEARVIERTAELAKSNAGLQAENTERKRGQEALKESQLRYRSLFDNMLDGYAYCRMLFEQDRPRDFIYLEVNSAFEKLTGLKNVIGKKVSQVIPGVQEANPELFEIYGRVATTGKAERFETHVESLGIWFSIAVYSPEKEYFVAVFDNITERKRTEETLRESGEKFRQLAENITDVFWIRSPDMQEVHYVSPAYERIWGRSAESLYAHPHQWTDAIVPQDRERVLAVFGTLMEAAPSVSLEYQIARSDGELCWVHARGFQVRDAADKLIRLTGIVTDISERKRAEFELEKVHQQLLETSRQAGMAEVATGVLHNVGNVLNSVNVSATLVADTTKKSKAPYLRKVVALLNEHAADLGGFMANDPKGRQLPGYLSQLAGQLAAEQQSSIAELESLRKNIEHIKDIVAMQQNYAKVSGVTETLQISGLLEDALRMNAGALTWPEAQIVRDYAEVPPVTIQKHKALQVLVNLIRNAKHACDDSGRTDKRLTLSVTNGGNRVRISIGDNGIGIPAENLIRIFNHGFTTRKEGHGFGLHSGALAAKELGGELNVQSDGVDQGATFTLALPLQPPQTIS